MLESTVSKKVQTVYFIAITVMMYYFLNEYIDLGVYITYRHAFALLIIFSAFVSFLITPNIPRAVVAVKSGFLLGVPTLVALMVSLYIWFVERADTDIIFRGLSSTLIYMNLISAALASAALLYIFGEKGIWYNLLAILISNFMMIITIIIEHGAGTYFRELWALISTFAADTGEVIVLAEIHELAFCLGTYILYMLLRPQKRGLFWVLFGCAAFCFISAFKRIAMVAIAVALLLGWLLTWLDKRGKNKSVSRIVTVIMAVVMVLLLVYLMVVKAGVFELMEKGGLDTSGRAGIYKSVDKYYEFSPFFLGHGIGFLTYQLNENMSIGVNSIHNDFLQFYVDLGFWGFLLWLYSMTFMRTGYFGRRGHGDEKIVVFSVLMYMIISSSTDNTLNYQLFNSATAMIMIGHGFDGRVREQEERLFDYVSAENRIHDTDHLL